MKHNIHGDAIAYADNLGNKIDSTLVNIDYKALFSMAEWHEKQSTIIRARAQKLVERAHMEKAAELRHDFLKKLPSVVMRYIKQGHTADHACKLTAEYTGVQLITVMHRWKSFLDDKQQAAVKKRNALALELHSLGFSNVNIADRLNLHPVTVSRILKTEKEKRYYRKNPDRIKLFSERDFKNVSFLSKTA